MNKPADLKLYIAVLDEVPDYIVPTLVAHAVLSADTRFSNVNYYEEVGEYPFYPDYLNWKCQSFKKVVLRVNRKEFEKISKLSDVYLAHENKTLNGEKSCVVICPRYEIPNVLKFAKMWKPKIDVDTSHEAYLNDKNA